MDEFTADEKSLINDAVTQYWHQAETELRKKDLGDIERKNWEGIRDQCRNLYTKLVLL